MQYVVELFYKMASRQVEVKLLSQKPLALFIVKLMRQQVTGEV